MNSRPITVIAHVRAKPGQEEALRQALLGLIEPSRRDAGCLSYDLHQSADQPDRFVFYENWTSKDLLDAHLGQPHVRAVLTRAEVLLAEPPEITLWTRLSGHGHK